jgi:hypothetical protein
MKAAQERGLMPSTGIGVGILASVLLGLLTLSVFFVLQDYGPESAIRTYNEAVLNGDTAAMDQISTQGHDDPDAEWLRVYVNEFLRQGGRLRLDRMDRDMDRVPAIAIAEVEYVRPAPPAMPWRFVVRKSDHVWKVDPRATHLLIIRQQQKG